MLRKSKLYVAVDADVIIMLVEVKEKMRNIPNYQPSKDRKKSIQNNADALMKILELMNKDELRLLVINTTFNEVKDVKQTMDFIKDNCYFPRLNILNISSHIEKADELAMKYCTQSYEYKGQKYYPPMELEYNRHLQRKVPSNDAYAMAEASIEKCIFITANSRHFVFRENYQKETNLRAIGIGMINSENGYETIDEKGRITSSRPMSLETFGFLIKNGVDNFFAPDVQEDKFIKADQITVM